jgi:hypothetical protein
MPARRRTTTRHRSTSPSSDSFTPAPAPKPEPQPAAPAPPPMPAATYDSQYTADVGGIRHGFQQGAARLGLDYGMQAQYDASGNPIGYSMGDGGRVAYDLGFGAGGQIDTRNPYSQAQVLQRFYDQDQRGIHNSMAAGGQLYSGARQRGLDSSTYNYQRNRTGLQTQASRSFEDAALAAQGQLGDYNQGIAQAGASQAGRWQDAQNEWYSRYGT